MITLHLSLSNPWAKENFKNLWCSGGSFTKNKHWEMEFLRHAHTFIELHFAYTARQDHAGLKLHCGLFGYCAEISVYDGRHWDYTNNCWINYGEYHE
jgi:hypothetical protein